MPDTERPEGDPCVTLGKSLALSGLQGKPVKWREWRCDIGWLDVRAERSF